MIDLIILLSLMLPSFLPDILTDNLEDGIIVANVSKIIDGDTFELQTGERIRLTLVNTPERGEQGYKEAKSWLSQTCLDKQNVIIDLDNGQASGSYGRLIGWVEQCGTVEDINQQMVDNGLAELYPQYCKVSEFKDRLCK